MPLKGISKKRILFEHPVCVLSIKMAVVMSKRSNIKCIIYGEPKKLCTLRLPTFSDVMLACQWIRHEKKNSKLEPKWKEIRNSIAEQIINV